MDYNAISSELASLVKPGSAILGLLVVIKFFHYVFDSNRIYRIKQLELLYNCLKEPNSSGGAYTIEKLLESTYKVHIPYDHVIAIMEHPKRNELFSIYKQANKYINFNGSAFELMSKFNTERAICIEKYRVQVFNYIKYYVSSFVSLILLFIGCSFFWAQGLTEIQFGTYNAVWFGLCFVISFVLGKIAINALINPTNISKAAEFTDTFACNVKKNRPVWLY